MNQKAGVEASELYVGSVNEQATVSTSSGMKRGSLVYWTPTAISLRTPNEIVMGGFRMWGNYYRRIAPLAFAAGPNVTIGFNVNNIDALSALQQHNWYAVFSILESDGTVGYRVIPFLRVGSVSGSVATFTYAGEGDAAHVITPVSYAWKAAGNLAGRECQVINETVGGRANAFSGRVASITGNTATTISLDAIGTVGPRDFLLPAPSAENYVYMGAFYYEPPGDVRNISDDGLNCKSYGIRHSQSTRTGAVSTFMKFDFGGYISPLATGVYLSTDASFSTTSVGQYVEDISADTAHILESWQGFKETAPNMSMTSPPIYCPFQFSQDLRWRNAGSLAAARSGGQLRVRGWVEL